MGDRLTIAVINGIQGWVLITPLPPFENTATRAAETTVPAPVGSLSLHTHAGCVSVLDRENRASAVEFRNHLADLRTQRLPHGQFSLPQAIAETQHTDIVKSKPGAFVRQTALLS